MNWNLCFKRCITTCIVICLLFCLATDQPYQGDSPCSKEQTPGTAPLFGEGRCRIQEHGLQRPHTQNKTYATVSHPFFIILKYL